MAPKYYVDRSEQANGDHEVHRHECNRLPTINNRFYLGEFNSCHQAVMAARKHYRQVNGCYYCSNAYRDKKENVLK
ncbi:MAG: hypothetical protein F4X93_05695 [Proteobacteria bacterium]|nr:hypothetical protein [Pseudomonadota bacterium]